MTDSWPEGWHPVEVGKVRTAWEDELRLEVGPKHVLWQQQARLIARRHDQDDALFELQGGRIAEVHLTWRRAREPHEKMPGALIFPSVDEWRRAKADAD